MQGKEFYGSGPGFPFFRDSGGSWPMLSEKDVVEAGLKLAVSIEQGERPMLKDMGNRLHTILFSLEGSARDDIVTELVRNGIKDIEPRVEILGITVTDNDDGDECYINIEWTLLKKNLPENSVVTVER